MTRQALKNCGLPIGDAMVGCKHDRVYNDPVTALVIGSVATAGASVYQASSAKKEAKKEAAKQAALIRKQEEKIAAEKEKQDREARARRERSMSQELLSGTELGVEEKPRLLG